MKNPDILALRAFLADKQPADITSSPLLQALGARFETYEEQSGQITLSFMPSELFRQGAGRIQGGAVSAMLDFGMAFAAFAQMEEEAGAASVSITTNIMAAAGREQVLVQGRLLRRGARVLFAEAEMHSGGKLIATASSTLFPLPPAS